MLHSFLLSLFAAVEVELKVSQLYCDALCEHGPAIANKQVFNNGFSSLSVCFFYFVLILYYLLENKYDDDVLVDRQCRLLNIYLLHCFV